MAIWAGGTIPLGQWTSFSDPELLFTTQKTKASILDKFENSAQL